MRWMPNPQPQPLATQYMYRLASVTFTLGALLGVGLTWWAGTWVWVVIAAWIAWDFTRLSRLARKLDEGEHGDD